MLAYDHQRAPAAPALPLPAQLAGRKIPIQIEQKEDKRKLESKVA